jgi:tetratricopeptide (TPR) repeat protein
VRSILKALGLTIWGAIAVGLAVIFVVVGFQVAMKYRASKSAFDFVKSVSDESTPTQPESSVGSVALPERAPDIRVPEAAPRATIETNCPNARRMPRIALDSPQRARLLRLLDSSEAAKAESGDAFVRLGELYYGFGEYELAIASLERGLKKGHVKYLAEAYVYLGRSEVAIGDIDAAQEAFAKLKDVPDISPGVLELWTLYAEMLSRNSNSAAAAVGSECRPQ